VVHPSSYVTSIAKKDLARIFLKQRSMWSNGERAKPIDQSASSELRSRFSQSVLGKSLAEVDSYWQGQVFSGRSAPPPTVASDAEVLDLVRRTPGAVGYVSASANTNGVSILTLL